MGLKDMISAIKSSIHKQVSALEKHADRMFAIPILISAFFSVCFFSMVLLSKLAVVGITGSVTGSFILLFGILVWGIFITLFYFFLNKVNFSSKMKVFIILTVAILARLSVMFCFPVNQGSDYALYYDVAQNIRQNLTVGASAEYILSIANNVVIYSSILALSFYIFGVSISAALFVNLVFSVLTMLLFFFVCKEFMSEKSAFFSAICLSLWPSYLLHQVFVATEPSFLFFLMLGLYLFLRAVKSEKPTKFILLSFLFSGILLSFSNEIRPIAIVLFFSLVLYLLYLLFTKAGSRKTVLLSLALFILSFSSLSAVSKLYISKVLDSKLPDSGFGWSLYEGTNTISWGTWNQKTSDELNAVIISTPDKSQVQEKMKNLAIKRLKTYDLKTIAKLEVYKAYNMWSGDNHSKDMLLQSTEKSKAKVDISKYNKVISVIVNNWYYAFLVLFLLSNLSIIIHFIKRRKMPVLLLMVLLPVTGVNLIHCFLTSIDRYKYPVIPFLIISAVLFLEKLFAERNISNK